MESPVRFCQFSSLKNVGCLAKRQPTDRCQTPQTQKFPEQLLRKLKFLLASSTQAAKSVTYVRVCALICSLCFLALRGFSASGRMLTLSTSCGLPCEKAARISYSHVLPRRSVQPGQHGRGLLQRGVVKVEGQHAAVLGQHVDGEHGTVVVQVGRH